jgi:hypothetical protein
MTTTTILTRVLLLFSSSSRPLLVLFSSSSRPLLVLFSSSPCQRLKWAPTDEATGTTIVSDIRRLRLIKDKQTILRRKLRPLERQTTFKCNFYRHSHEEASSSDPHRTLSRLWDKYVGGVVWVCGCVGVWWCGWCVFYDDLTSFVVATLLQVRG